MGLITKAVPAAELDAAVDAACAELLKAHPQGLRETKKVLSRDMLAYLEAHADDMIALSAKLFSSEEAKDAMLAFLSKK